MYNARAEQLKSSLILVFAYLVATGFVICLNSLLLTGLFALFYTIWLEQSLCAMERNPQS